jgi:hypothetical protein
MTACLVAVHDGPAVLAYAIAAHLPLTGQTASRMAGGVPYRLRATACPYAVLWYLQAGTAVRVVDVAGPGWRDLCPKAILVPT